MKEVLTGVERRGDGDVTRQGWQGWTTIKRRAPPPSKAEAFAVVLEAVERRFSPVISWGYIAARHSQRPGMDAFSPQPTAAPPSTIRCVCVYVACVCESLSHVRLFVIPWTMARQAPLSMKCSRQGYWPGVPFPSPGSLPDPGVKAGPAALQPDSLPAFSPQRTPSPTLYHKGSCISLWMLYLLLHLSLALECAHSKTIRT